MTSFQIRPTSDQILHKTDGGKVQFVAPAKNIDGGDHPYRAIAIRLDAQSQDPQNDNVWEFSLDEFDVELLCQELWRSDPRLAYSMREKPASWRRGGISWESDDKTVQATSAGYSVLIRLRVDGQRSRLLPDGRADYMPRTSDVRGLVKAINEAAYGQYLELDYQMGDKGSGDWRPLPARRTYVSTTSLPA